MLKRRGRETVADAATATPAKIKVSFTKLALFFCIFNNFVTSIDVYFDTDKILTKAMRIAQYNFDYKLCM